MRSGFIGIIGVPNAGKSSLVNKIVEESVSIVTKKPQTTRKRTLGIVTVPENYQMIFVDTPGVTDSSEGLNLFLKKELDRALEDVDVVIATIAPWEFDSSQRPWVLEVPAKVPTIYVATQSDRVKIKDEIFEKWKKFFDKIPPPLYLTSSRTGDGIKALKSLIMKELPEGPLYFPSDVFTPQSMREMTSEVIRKHCFQELHQEIPYGLAVVTQTFEEDKVYKIAADIVVSKESHKPMVIGQNGQLLKIIGTKARLELEKAFDHKIFLKLHVVSRPGWMKNHHFLKELGFEHGIS